MNRFHCFLPLLILVFGVCAVTIVNAQDTESAVQSNYLSEKSHSVDGRLFIGPQPKSTDIQNLKDEGIQLVVNFRTPSEMVKLNFGERQRLADLGIDYVEIPVGGGKYPYSPAQLTALSDVLQQEGKVLLHCRSGQRASVITVAYLIEKQGMPIDEAVKHAEGWWPLQLQDVLGEELSLSRKSTVK